MLMVHSAMVAMTGAGLSGGPVVGQRLFRASGSFVFPVGVATISAVCIGAGGLATMGGFATAESGAGGGLSFLNDIPGTPEEALTVQVTQNFSRILRGATVLLSANGAALYGYDKFGVADNGHGQWTGYAGGAGVAARDYGDPSIIEGASLAGGGAAKYTNNGAYNSGGTSLYGAASGAELAGEGQRIGPFDAEGTPAAVSGGSPPGVYIIWGEGRYFPNNNVAPIT